MFLKDLYKYNKIAAISVMIFALALLVVNYKWGTVATPISSYGMYSQLYNVKDTQSVYKIVINKKEFVFNAFSFSDRDKIFIFLDNLKKEKEVNTNVINVMQGYFSKIGLGKLMTNENYTNKLDSSNVKKWVLQKLTKVYKAPINYYEIDKQQYLWLNGILTPITQPTKIISFEN